jgi:hypothetical protein
MPRKFQSKGLKKQKKSYSGKKKTHTFKVQAMIHYKTQQILSLCTSRGAVHDFELFKRNLNQIPFGAFILADKGYQGIYVMVERLWRSVKYEEVYLKAYSSVTDAKKQLSAYFEFYNLKRPHSSLDKMTPNEFYYDQLPQQNKVA